MAHPLQSLLKDTAVYGLSSVVGRFLNWLLTALYSRVLLTGEFGVMTNLYAVIALLLIVLTYGMETSFFRFTSTHERPTLVYSTVLRSVGTTSLLFLIGGLLLLDPITAALGREGDRGLVAMLLAIVALDAFATIPLGYLRYAQRPWWFMGVRMGFILLTILLTILAFYGLPWLAETFPSVCGSWYAPGYGLYYIMGINLVGNVVQILMLSPTFRHARAGFDWSLLRRMLSYAWPILLLGLVGSFNNQADKLLFPRLFEDRAVGESELGIYSACYKIAVIMILFTQAFRYAYDPFVFARSKEGGEAAKTAYTLSMKYYVIFTLFIFLGVMSTLELLQYFVGPDFRSGLAVVPWVMAGQLLFGIYFNLSLWYKLTDRTYWGAILSVVGCVLTVLIIVLGTPHYSYMACAWASVLSNGAITLLSYLLAQRYYPIAYELRRMGLYALLVVVLLSMQWLLTRYVTEQTGIRLAFNLTTCLIYLGIVMRLELPKATLQSLLARLRR